MPLIRDWNIPLQADDVLRAQGSNPAAVRARRPALVDIADWAAEQAQDSLEPAVLYERFKVAGLHHKRLHLEPLSQEGEFMMSGTLIADHLAAAEEILVVACTIGGKLEKTAREWMDEDILKGLALDAAGSVAAEHLGEVACRRFESQARERGLRTTIPLGPGMTGWSVEEGQPQIFSLLQKEFKRTPQFNLVLTESQIMIPRKSISFVLGLGREISSQGRTCDYCDLKETCRYQEHYA